MKNHGKLKASNVGFSIIGVDLYPDFIERSIVNHQKYKKFLDNQSRIQVDY